MDAHTTRSSAGRTALRTCWTTQRRKALAKAGKTYVDPVVTFAKAWAPATVANLGPGFDWMGCAVQGEGDTVTASVLPDQPGKVVITEITGDNGRLPLTAEENCIGIAAIETLKLIGQPSCGISLTLEKGLPLGSGMGSSAASAAAACWAVNNIFGNPVSKQKLIMAGLQSEAFVSGYHADNIAPALLGGFVLIRSTEPLEIYQLPFDAPLYFVLVNPKFEAPTREMRAALPTQVPFKSLISNSVQGGALIAGIAQGNSKLVGEALDSEIVVEAARGPLIPGFASVKAAAKAAGAYGCTISGAGPTAVAIVDDKEVGHAVATAMSAAFKQDGNLETNSIQVVALDGEGARSV